jgi:hypothetical protein
MCVSIFSTNLSKPFLVLRRTKRDRSKSYIVLHVKSRQSCKILVKREFCRQIFEKYSNIKFHEIPSSESRAVPCGRADRQTDMTKLIVALRNLAKAPKNAHCVVVFKVLCFLRPMCRAAGSLASSWFISYRIISVKNSTKRKQ